MKAYNSPDNMDFSVHKNRVTNHDKESNKQIPVKVSWETIEKTVNNKSYMFTDYECLIKRVIVKYIPNVLAALPRHP